MTDEEYERLKEAEKSHLRAKKRLQATLDQLKQRNEVQGALRRMKQGAQRVLTETESLVNRLRSAVAQREARFEVALGEEWDEDADLREAEEELREERAEQLVRRMKAEEAHSSTRPGDSEGRDDTGSGEQGEDPDADVSPPKGPDKTIGRMGDLRPDDSS
jgi:hypothetical protein